MISARPMIALMLAVSFVATAGADDGAGRIEVEASGVATQLADAFEVRFKVTASAGLASDAIQKFLSIKKRLKRGFADTEIEGLEIVGEEFTVSTNPVNQDRFSGRVMVINGVLQNQGDPNSRVHLSEIVVVAVPVKADGDLKEALLDVSLVVDIGIDLELEAVGNANPNNFNPSQQGPKFISRRVADPDELERQATKDAVRQAREEAQQVASAAGVSVGKAIKVELRKIGEVTADKKEFSRASRSVTVRVAFEIE